MRHVLLRLTDEEFKLLEDHCNGIPKQKYCMKKIFDEPVNEPDFESEQFIDDKDPEFYFNVHFKLSPKERDLLDKLKGDMTLQEFCRKAVLNKKIVRLDELKQMKYHISKIGNNINQIARVGNQTGVIDETSVDNLIEAFVKLTEEIKKISDAINERLD